MALKLLSSVTFGSLALKNRVVLAPLTRARAGPSRLPNELMLTYYEQRANAGLLITEATGISEQGYGWYGAPGIYTDEQATAWKPIVHAVHTKGAKFFLQLWHMGRQGHPSFHAGETVAPSAIAIPGEGYTRDANGERVQYVTPRALETSEIPALVQSYKHAATLAKKAGFDGVEVHAANGYLIDTFLQSSTNHRTDEYGGSVANRYRLLKEVVTAVGEVYPYDRIGVRISPNGMYGGMGSEDNDQTFQYVASELSHFKLAYLHVMDGLGFGFHGKSKVFTLFDAKTHFQGPVIGNIDYTKEMAEGAIRSGTADLISFGRSYISNPDLVERFTNDWPLAPPASHEIFYGGGAKGYTDFETYKPQ